MITFDAFKSRHLGNKADYDKMHGGECVDLYNFYMRDVFGLNPYRFGGVNSAYQLRENLKKYPEIQWIDNNPNDANQIPPKGSIVIFSKNLPGSGGHGHVGICDDGTSSASLFVFDQQGHPNEALEKPPASRRYNWNNVLGWAILKNNVPAQSGGGDEMISTRDDAIEVYQTLRPNGQPSEGEISATAGRRSYRQFIVDGRAERKLRDEALRQKDIYIQAMQNDIGSLKRQVEELRERPTKSALENLEKNLAVMKSGTEEHLKHIADLEKQIADRSEAEKFTADVIQEASRFFSLNKINAIFRKLRLKK